MGDFPKIVKRQATGANPAGTGNSLFGVTSRVFASALLIEVEIMPTLPGAINGSNQISVGVRSPSNEHSHTSDAHHFSFYTEFVSGIQYRLIPFEHTTAEFTTRPLVNVGDRVTLDVYAPGHARLLVNGILAFEYVPGMTIDAYGNHGGPYQPEISINNDNQQIKVIRIVPYDKEWTAMQDVYPKLNKAVTTSITTPSENSSVQINSAFDISVAWLDTTYLLNDLSPIEVDSIEIFVDGVSVHKTSDLGSNTPFKAYGANPYVYHHAGVAIIGVHTIQATVTDEAGLQVQTAVRHFTATAPPPEVDSDFIATANYAAGAGFVKKTGPDGWTTYTRLNHDIAADGDIYFNKIDANSDSYIGMFPIASPPNSPESFDGSAGGTLEIYGGAGNYAFYRGNSNLFAGGYANGYKFQISVRGGQVKIYTQNTLRFQVAQALAFPFRIWYGTYTHLDTGINVCKLVDGFAP